MKNKELIEELHAKLKCLTDDSKQLKEQHEQLVKKFVEVHGRLEKLHKDQESELPQSNGPSEQEKSAKERAQD